jgi:hypothetical protein
MTYYGFGIGMLIMGIGVIDSFIDQVTKAAVTQEMGIACWQVAAQSIDGDLHNEPDISLFSCYSRAEHGAEEHGGQNSYTNSNLFVQDFHVKIRNNEKNSMNQYILAESMSEVITVTGGLEGTACRRMRN